MPAGPLRVGMVPEHFMAPLHWAQEKGIFSQHGVKVEFIICPRGTGDMCSRLRSGGLDCAVAVTEGLIADVAKNGAGVRLLQSFTETPITLGVWAAGQPAAGVKGPAAVEELQEARRVFGVSRLGSNSHLMACVFAVSKGWGPPAPARFHASGGLPELIRDVNAGATDAFLWERLTTTPHQRRGEVRLLAEFRAPWHAFTLCAAAGAAAARRAEVAALCAATVAAVREFRADPAAALEFTAARFPQQPRDELRRAVCGPGAVTEYGLGGFPPGGLEECARILRAAGQLPREVGLGELLDPALPELRRRLSPAKL